MDPGDLVLRGGRVLDPATSRDQAGDVRIAGGKIGALIHISEIITICGASIGATDRRMRRRFRRPL